MRYILTLCCITFWLILPLAAQSIPQTEWQRTIGGSGEDRPRAVLIAADGSTYLAFTSDSDDGDLQDLREGKGACVSRLSERGEILWIRCWGGEDDALRHLAELENGDILAAGSVQFDDSSADSWVARIDPQGNLVWLTTYGTADQTENTSAIAVSGPDSIWLFGHRIDSSLSDTRQVDPYIRLIDGKGNEKMYREFDFGYQESTNDAVRLKDGSLLLSASFRTMADNGELLYHNYLLAQISPDGSLLQTNLVITPFAEAPIDIVLKKEDPVVVRQFAPDGYLPNNFYEMDVILSGVTPSLGILPFQRRFGGSGIEFLYESVSLGEWVCFFAHSFSQDGDLQRYADLGSSVPWLACIKEEFRIAWDTIWRDRAQESRTFGKLASSEIDSSLALATYHIQGPNRDIHLQKFRLRPPAPDTTVTCTEPLLYPNPGTAARFEVSLPGNSGRDWELTVYDALGRRVIDRQPVAPNGTVELPPGLPSGVYWVRMRCPDGEVYGRKWVLAD